MNIFMLDSDPMIAAQYHADKHVVKMILETAQMLSTVVREKGTPYGYTSTHVNHPCVRWAGENTANFLWLKRLGMSLCEEYIFRYSPMHSHASEHIIRDCPLPEGLVEASEKTPMIQCMPEELRDPDSDVQAYRNYYLAKKTHLLQYTRRHPPEWMTILGFGEHK